MFIDQFLLMLNNQDDSIFKYYISMDKACNELTPHLDSIFTYLRNQAIQSTRSCSIDGLNVYAGYLQRILNEPDACESFLSTQTIMNSTNPNTIPIQISQDYLLPFFSLHPADFLTAPRIIDPDISTIPAINSTRSQYVSLMNNTSITTVFLYLSCDSRTFYSISLPHSFVVKQVELVFEIGLKQSFLEEMNFSNPILNLVALSRNSMVHF